MAEDTFGPAGPSRAPMLQVDLDDRLSNPNNRRSYPKIPWDEVDGSIFESIQDPKVCSLTLFLFHLSLVTDTNLKSWMAYKRMLSKFWTISQLDILQAWLDWHHSLEPTDQELFGTALLMLLPNQRQISALDRLCACGPIFEIECLFALHRMR